jgi:hypothetical protein
MPFTFGNAFNRFFSLLGSNFGPFAIIGLICTILPAMALIYVEFSFLGMTSASHGWIPKLTTYSTTHSVQTWAFASIGGLVVALFNLMSLSAITEVAILRSVNKPVNYGALAGHALMNAIPLLIVLIFVGLLVGLGFIMLVVPGVIWALCTCVSVPAYVGESKLGIFGAIGRSFQLTRDHRWSLLLLFIVIYVGLMVVSGGLSAALFALPGGMTNLPAILARGFVSGLVSLVIHVLVASIYVSLRESKEKTTPDATAAVF